MSGIVQHKGRDYYAMKNLAETVTPDKLAKVTEAVLTDLVMDDIGNVLFPKEKTDAALIGIWGEQRLLTPGRYKLTERQQYYPKSAEIVQVEDTETGRRFIIVFNGSAIALD